MNRFPFFDHRTLAEVAATERFATVVCGSRHTGGHLVAQQRRLTELLAKTPNADIYPLRPREPDGDRA